MNRRQFLNSTASYGVLCIPVAMLQACSSTATPTAQTLTAQILSDTGGVITGIQGLVPQLEAAKPPLITAAQGDTILADAGLAAQSLATLSTSTALAPGATTLGIIFGGLNTAVAILSALPIPPPYTAIVMALSVVLPAAEAELTAMVGTQPAPVPPAVASTRAKALNSGMSLDAARVQLNIKAS